MAKVTEAVVDVNDVSHIASGVYIKGEMTCPGDVRVDGHIEGKLSSKGRVVIGEGAHVDGTVICDSLDFWGSIDGDIFVRDTLSLKAGSSAKGSINVRRLQVEMGAAINGTCKMIGEEEIEKLV